jgi:outer membrane protein OmpA-like peptidoglycan-associated protein
MPPLMHLRIRAAFLASLCVGWIQGECQQRTQLLGTMEAGTLMVRGMAGDPQEAVPVFQATWRQANGQATRFSMQQTALAHGDANVDLDQLLVAAVDAYLDAHIRFERNGVRAEFPVPRMMQDLDDLVRAAADGLGHGAPWQGFSQPTRAQLERITRIDWSQARFSIDGADDQDKYLAIYYYVRVQRDELEHLVRQDLAALEGPSLLATSATNASNDLRVNTVCGTVFDEENYLCALDLTVSGTEPAGVDPQLSRLLLKAMETRADDAETTAVNRFKPRKRDLWLKEELDRINDRIDRMDQRRELWTVRDRLDDLEARIMDLHMEVREMQEERPRHSPDNPIANLSELTGRNITVRFARNSISLDPEYRVLLNEVFEQLARNPADRVLITGYTDRSGDPAVNLRLSEQRAKAVRNYLLSRGISSERLLVNYYGESRSGGRNPDERRVEVEWLR